MIDKYVDRFMANKKQLENILRVKHPNNYKELVTNVIKVITSKDYGDIDPNRIHQIDDGDYQGTLVYIIAAEGYQPDRYWSIKVSYGSCSGCDTLESIRSYDSDPPNAEQVEKYMTLALNIVQWLKEV